MLFAPKSAPCLLATTCRLADVNSVAGRANTSTHCMRSVSGSESSQIQVTQARPLLVVCSALISSSTLMFPPTSRPLGEHALGSPFLGSPRSQHYRPDCRAWHVGTLY